MSTIAMNLPDSSYDADFSDDTESSGFYCIRGRLKK